MSDLHKWLYRGLPSEFHSRKSKLSRLMRSRLVTSDDDYSLFAVVVFKRFRDAFTQKCRENKLVAPLEVNVIIRS